MAALSEEAEDHMKSATAWALGQLGRHTPDHAKAVADTGVLPLLVTLENDTHSSEDLKGKCRKALKAIVAKLTFMPALDALVHRSGNTPHRSNPPPPPIVSLVRHPVLASDSLLESSCHTS